MLTELLGKGGKLCQPAQEGKLRCPLIVRPNAEDPVTGNLMGVLKVLQPRWWLPDLLNAALGTSRFDRQVFPRLAIDLWKNRPVFPRELLTWAEGSSQIDVSIAWEWVPTTVFWEFKYTSPLSPHTTNADPQGRFPNDQLIRNIRNGLLEAGWYDRGGLFLAAPRDFVQVVVAPQRGEPLVARYSDPDRLLASIPFSEKLKGLPRVPFVGELSYRDIIDVLKRQRRFFTAPERKLIDLGCEYLAYKITHMSGTGVTNTAPDQVA
jgi:hypothetical protein